MAKVRRFEFSDGASDKFWQITDKGIASWGRIGSNADIDGNGPSKKYKTDDEITKMIKSKVDKGYEEIY